MDGYTGTVIIPAMGKSERFKAVGYMDHKALLVIEDEHRSAPMIIRILDTIPENWNARIIVPAELADRFATVLSKYLSRIDIIVHRGETAGQSSTILYGLSGLKASDQVAVTNCDVEINSIVVNEVLSYRGTKILLHEHATGDPIFSYARIEQDGTIGEIAEKRRISNWAQTGLWKFGSVARLRKALISQIGAHDTHTNGELYLSGAINRYHHAKLPHFIRRDDWIDYGTPASIESEGMKIAANG